MIAIIAGGLGNQMFQYATAYAISRDANVNLRLDVTNYALTHSRKYLLDEFCLELRADRSVFTRGLRLFWLKRIFAMLVLKTTGRDVFRQHECISEAMIRGRAIESDVLCGYFQSEKYFCKYRDELIKQFTPKHSYSLETKDLMGEIRRTESSCSVHFRRGDYVKIGIALGIDYYTNALEEIKKLGQNIVFYVFSDDIEYVRCVMNWNQYNVRFVHLVNETADIDEMMLMASCQHNIIANSTYSWWAAWLNRTPDKVVICPKDILVNNQDIVPDGWRVL